MPAKSKQKTAFQYAALPYRIVDGQPMVLLVTSRETKRWILPKGQPERKLTPYQVAEQEAYEEAGLIGTVFKTAFGSFRGIKKLKTGKEVVCEVLVFLLEVSHQLGAWPEQNQRERRWVTPEIAADMVSEPELSQILKNFSGRFE